jgi:type III secretory pathway component EscV
MVRSIVAFLGLVTAGVGIWLITIEQPKNAACNASHPTISHLTQVGVGSSCLNIVWSYFGGFALLAFGILTVTVAFVMSRKVRKNKGPRRAEPLTYPYERPF